MSNLLEQSASVSIMLDSELIDAALEQPSKTLAYQLACRVDRLNIIHRNGTNKGLFFSLGELNSLRDKKEDELQSEIAALEDEVGLLTSKLEDLNLDRLTLGVQNAKRAIRETHQKIDYLLNLGNNK